MENLNDEGILKSYVLNTNDLNVNRILYRFWFILMTCFLVPFIYFMVEWWIFCWISFCWKLHFWHYTCPTKLWRFWSVTWSVWSQFLCMEKSCFYVLKCDDTCSFWINDDRRHTFLGENISFWKIVTYSNS